MKSTSSLLFVLGLLIALGQGMASRVEAAPPAWSQKIAGASRFNLVLDNAAVLDRETNLVWEKSPDTTTRNWPSALYFCNDRSVGGRKGWRLPTIQELASLVDPNNPGGNPDLPPGHPFSNVQSSGYWSATSNARSPGDAWFVYLVDGVVGLSGQGEALYGWCVRSEQGGPDAQ